MKLMTNPGLVLEEIQEEHVRLNFGCAPFHTFSLGKRERRQREVEGGRRKRRMRAAGRKRGGERSGMWTNR